MFHLASYIIESWEHENQCIKYLANALENDRVFSSIKFIIIIEVFLSYPSMDVRISIARDIQGL